MAHPDEAYIWFELKYVLKSDLRSGQKSNVSLTLRRKQRKKGHFWVSKHQCKCGHTKVKNGDVSDG